MVAFVYGIFMYFFLFNRDYGIASLNGIRTKFHDKRVVFVIIRADVVYLGWYGRYEKNVGVEF